MISRLAINCNDPSVSNVGRLFLTRFHILEFRYKLSLHYFFIPTTDTACTFASASATSATTLYFAAVNVRRPSFDFHTSVAEVTFATVI